MLVRKEKVLVTGSAGFIGFHVSNLLIEMGYSVVGIDNMNDYYEVSLKEDRLKHLNKNNSFSFIKAEISNTRILNEAFTQTKPDYVIHLAAQAGVRYSLDYPFKYADTNLVGFLSVLEACRHTKVKHLLYASSSSVYGESEQIPFTTEMLADKPISLYAATKRANELMAHSYAHLFQLPVTGLRFFTAYGPWGRPDMAYFRFTKAIVEGRPIQVFDYGRGVRDYTYIDDIAAGIIICLLQTNTSKHSGISQLYNIGSGRATSLLQMIEWLEEIIGKKANIQFQAPQAGDVSRTLADIGPISKDFGFTPKTTLKEGLSLFFEWYRDYYNL